MGRVLKISLSIWLALGMVTAQAQSTTKLNAKKKNATKGQSAAAAVVPSAKPSFLAAPTIRKPATLDPNSAVEVRGQARTLSMMLVLKNGKDSINFIKVRKDYRPEILGTEY